jgi:acyl-CoA thioesterase
LDFFMACLFVDGDTPRDPSEKQFELKGWIDTAPFEDLCGIVIEDAMEGRAVLSMPFVLKLAQGGGVAHGGALTTLADTAVAMAIKSFLPEGTIFATTELTTRFLAPVRQGLMRARASVSSPVGRTLHGEAIVTDEEGREVAAFTCVFRIARGQGYGE